MREVVFFTEGGKKYGLGHIVRCISIKNALAKFFPSIIFIIKGDESISNILKEENVKIIDWNTNIYNFNKIVKEDNLVIIDSLEIDKDLISYISNTFQDLVIIDDYRRLNYKNGLIIDWTIGCENFYENKKDILAGTKYTALRSSFSQVGVRKIKNKIESALIIIGGSDHRDLTPFFLDWLLDSEYYNMTTIYVVLTKSFYNYNGIIDKAKKNRNILIKESLNEIEIKNLFVNVDIAISASGQTLYELACCGTPTISVQTAENQLYDAKGWELAKFTVHLGNWDSTDLEEKFKKALILLQDKSEREERCRIGKSYIDGQGANRIAEEIKNRFYQKSIQL